MPVAQRHPGRSEHGDCRLRCNADGRCDPRGGIPFFCLGENREGGCHPTGFGMPCLDDSECYGDLKCKNVGSDERSRTKYNPNICTLACLTDADCDANHLTFHAGFCQPASVAWLAIRAFPAPRPVTAVRSNATASRQRVFEGTSVSTQRPAASVTRAAGNAVFPNSFLPPAAITWRYQSNESLGTRRGVW